MEVRWTRRASTATRRDTNRDAPAQVVGKEKAFVEGETAKAEKEAALVAVIQKDVGEKQRCDLGVLSRHRRASPPSSDEVGGFLSILSLWKTSRRVRESAFMKMA